MINKSFSNVEEFFTCRYLTDEWDINNSYKKRFSFEKKMYRVILYDYMKYYHSCYICWIVLSSESESKICMFIVEDKKVVRYRWVSSIGNYNYSDKFVIDSYTQNLDFSNNFWIIILWFNLDFSSLSRIIEDTTFFRELKSLRILLETGNAQSFLIQEHNTEQILLLRDNLIIDFRLSDTDKKKQI